MANLTQFTTLNIHCKIAITIKYLWLWYGVWTRFRSTMRLNWEGENVRTVLKFYIVDRYLPSSVPQRFVNIHFHIPWPHQSLEFGEWHDARQATVELGAGGWLTGGQINVVRWLTAEPGHGQSSSRQAAGQSFTFSITATFYSMGV